MRLEQNDPERRFMLTSELRGFFQQELMAEMHAVKVADGGHNVCCNYHCSPSDTAMAWAPAAASVAAIAVSPLSPVCTPPSPVT